MPEAEGELKKEIEKLKEVAGIFDQTIFRTVVYRHRSLIVRRFPKQNFSR
jgi:hypothetical protein